MRAWLANKWDEQVGLDEYLPGTPRMHQNLLEFFPYHIWGRSSMPTKDEANSNTTFMERKFREQDAVRRRQFPSCFEEACAYGNLQAAILMWSQGTVDIPSRKAVYEGNNASALMWASFKGHLAIVRFLVDHGAPLNVTNTLGHTALMWAITAGHTDVARYLLDHGADPAHRDRQGFDAAFSAVQNDRLALLLMLTEDASREGHLLQTSDHGVVFYQPSPEQRAQAVAATTTLINPRTQKPYYLLDPSMRDVEGHSLMHWAAYRNSPATCQYLIDHWGYAVDVKDKHGRTPLVWAAREGFAEVIEILLSRGANRNCADSDNWTALQYARTRNHPEAVYVLETYPVAAVSPPVSTSNTEDAIAGGIFREAESSVEDWSNSTNNVLDVSVKAALLSGGNSSGNRRGSSSSSAGATAAAVGNSAGGGRYVCVRDRRAYGTLQMIRTYTLFAAMAAFGPFYLVLTYITMNFLPPLFSYFPYGLYFFKNVLWATLTPPPTQSSRTGPSLPMTKQMGIAANIAESVRGTWLFRVRDPANLFLWISFLLLQVWVWNSLGLPPLFTSSSGSISRTASASGLWPTHPPSSVTAIDAPPPPVQLVHYFGLSFFRCLTLRPNPFREFGDYTAYESPVKDLTSTARANLNAAAQAYAAQSESIVRWVLMLLCLATVVCALLCKVLSARSMMRSSEEGTLRTSPLWRIVAARQYKWLHPRFFFQERHLQFPLRAFYCHERDVVVHGYDGYSILLDSPIGQSNHLLFVLTLTCFTLYELLLLLWGYQTMRSLLHCPVRVPWYRDAFFAFQSTDTMEAALKSRAGFTFPAASISAKVAAAAAAGAENVAMSTSPTSSPTTAITAVLTTAAPVMSFAWLNNAMEIMLHGLPCRQYQRLDEITWDYLRAVAASKASVVGSEKQKGGSETGTTSSTEPSSLIGFIRRVFFLVQYYLWPTRASALGVWVLHYSCFSAFAIGCVAVRQWIGVWYGATRIELANPLAQGSDGNLVSIFPKDAQLAQPVAPVDADEERYYAEACPEKARPVDRLPEEGNQCIYADGSGPVNVLSFLLGRWGRRWRGATAVSSHNAPVKTPMLM